MDDSKFGTEDARGYWKPIKSISYGPFFEWPPKPKPLFKWFFGFPGYLLPWNLLYALAAIIIWLYLTPPLEKMTTLKIDWIGFILLRNFILLIAITGSWHLWLYVWRKQDTKFKYNRSWPNKKSKVFLFSNQTYDNMFWTLVSGVPIWTTYEVLLLWAYANGIAPMINFNEHPIGFVALFFLIPFVHEVGFYFCHRALHWPPLYKIAHKVHHQNINPGPWSGISMHPLEHLMYFAIILLIFIFPTHPIHMINLASRLGLLAVVGHTGFDHIVVGKKTIVNTSYYAHYLHHKYFEVNYADGMVPLDKWFGSFHDGSTEGDEIMKARQKKRSS
jgi:sterol desaturase/sphingolipid hydroxylase (fatty acid hydroxylase superfamily)